MTIATTRGTQRFANREMLAAAGLEITEPATATAAAGAATLNQGAGFVTSEALTTAAGSTYSLTLTNSFIDVNTMIHATVQLGSSTQGTPCVTTCIQAAGSATINVKNIDATNALNGTIKIGFFLVRKGSAPL